MEIGRLVQINRAVGGVNDHSSIIYQAQVSSFYASLHNEQNTWYNLSAALQRSREDSCCKASFLNAITTPVPLRLYFTRESGRSPPNGYWSSPQPLPDGTFPEPGSLCLRQPSSCTFHLGVVDRHESSDPDQSIRNFEDLCRITCQVLLKSDRFTLHITTALKCEFVGYLRYSSHSVLRPTVPGCLR